MSCDREGREILRARAVLLHVRAHQLRVQRQERFGAAAFELGVGGCRQCAGNSIVIDMGHALEAAGDHRVVNAAGDRQIRHARGRATRSTRCFDRRRFHAGEPGVIGHQAADLLLAREQSGHHVADVQSADLICRKIRIFKRDAYGLRAEITAANVAVLVHGRLSHADDEHVPQARPPSTPRRMQARMMATHAPFVIRSDYDGDRCGSRSMR